MPFVYILRCCDGSFYVGSTRNIETRLEQHNSGNGAKYTSSRIPVALVFCEEYDNVGEAFAAEKRIQGWSRAKREALIDGRLELLPPASARRTRYERKGDGHADG